VEGGGPSTDAGRGGVKAVKVPMAVLQALKVPNNALLVEEVKYAVMPDATDCAPLHDVWWLSSPVLAERTC
jgi:hypothetical protein